ncbi:caspase family protein [Streptomyces sp. NPDC090056]|uniref:HD domain-containing protein n=1 Tax=Streptomyces sp. NPDC090056 TaxID=3365934 RepID=UPI00383009FE
MSTTAETGTETGPGTETETGPGGDRRALLIGIRDTEYLARNPLLAAAYPPLACVDEDVRRIEAALRASDYEVTSFHPGHSDEEHRDTSKDMILAAMVDFFGSCAPGDTALVYVSGHGVVLDGRDYILPWSARASAGGTLISGTLIETVAPELLGSVPEGVSVVVCLDTCRTETAGSAPKVPKPLVGDEYDDVVWLRAGSHGQEAFADPKRGSHFGFALSEALSPERPPQTLGEIGAFVRTRVRSLAQKLRVPAPAVVLKAARGREDWARDLRLCQGSEETDHWAEVLRKSGLWTYTSGTPEVHTRVKEALAELAAEVARSRTDTQSELATPWHDPLYLERVVHVLERLVEDARLQPFEYLSPAETAALLAAPLLHEGVVAVALSELASLRPDRLDRVEDNRGRDPEDGHDRLVCDAAADVCRAHSRVTVTAETLRKRKEDDAAKAADHWLRHRFIADWDRLWDRSHSDYGSVHQLLDMVVNAVTAGAVGTSTELTTVDRHVRRVLPHMTVAPGSSPRIDDTGSPTWSRTEKPVPGNAWRDFELAYLLWLAALLAADPRRMSSVLVDHLGAHVPLAPADVVDALARTDWEREVRDGLPHPQYALRLSCPHPALHAALEELAATADASVHDHHRRVRVTGQPAPDLLRGIPRRVTTDHLKPVDPTAYSKPLERFRLAEDEIRPLLMGTQLYGDRMLAVRELYQNALDACRYRKQRTAYGRSREAFHSTDPELRITFRQGYEGNRAYIECEDSGAGMSREKLTSMFARAGKRYEQDPDYVQERRNWRRAGMKPVPFNSRFGIGVFSYFMLAEEVTVDTAAVDRHGNPARSVLPLHATVQSGSGLLQIREIEGGGPKDGGTVVRLYLSAEQDGEHPPSVVETLRRLLWVSEFHVTAEERDRDENLIRSKSWKPGVLRAPEHRAREWYGKPVKAGEESWIVQGAGQLLLDGILVGEASSVYGCVFNLQERHRPEPSVNRNSLLTYDEKGVREELLNAVRHVARKIDAMALTWLWNLAHHEPRLALQLLRHVSPDAVGVIAKDATDHVVASDRVPLRHTGVLAMDATFVMDLHGPYSWPQVSAAERALLQRWRFAKLGIVTRGETSFVPEGYPEPTALDALLFSRNAFHSDWSPPLTAAARADVPLAAALRALRRYAITGVRVPAVPDIRKLSEAGTPTSRTAALHLAYEQAARVRNMPNPDLPAVHAPLVSVAADHEVPLSHLLDDLDVLTRIGIEVPDPGPLRSADLGMKFLASEALLLARDSSEGKSWRDGMVPPADLLSRVEPPEQRRRLVERIRELGPLGFSLSEAVGEETLDHPALTAVELKTVSHDIDGMGPWLAPRPLTMWQLIDRASALQRPLGAMADEIDALTPVTGISAPVVPAECRTWAPSPWIHDPRGTSVRRAPFGEARRGDWRLVFGAHRAEPRPSPQELRTELSRLEACGVLTASVDDLVEQVGRIAPVVVSLLDEAFPEWPDRDPVWTLGAGGLSWPLLLRLSLSRHALLGSLVDELDATDTRLPLGLPVLPEEARSLRPVETELARVLRDPSADPSFKAALTVRDLLELATFYRCTLREAADALGAYRCLGGPELPGALEDGPLAELEPTLFDLVAFEESLLGPGALGPLELVLVAGRFGWTLGEAYDRYAPFEALGLRVGVEPKGEERDIVPGWADVVVLTEQLTGRSPAISGTVTAEHVVLCAEETERTEDEVLDLLRPYVGLFELDLPEAGGPRP